LGVAFEPDFDPTFATTDNTSVYYTTADPSYTTASRALRLA
jgi:hypothetical protein